VGDLTLSGDLCKLAQRWAEHLSSIDNLEHSRSTYRDQPLGENIAYKSSSTKEGYAGLQCFASNLSTKKSQARAPPPAQRYVTPKFAKLTLSEL